MNFPVWISIAANPASLYVTYNAFSWHPSRGFEQAELSKGGGGGEDGGCTWTSYN